MKSCVFTVELTSHILANSMSAVQGQRDHFQRDSNRKLVFQQSWFYSAFSQAIQMAHIRGIKPADINMDLSVSAHTEIYRRKYGDNKYREHEAIMPGERITFNAVVSDHVTESNLRNILDKMGRFVGLSPYGHNLGYGRFTVVSVEVESGEYDQNHTDGHAVGLQPEGQQTT